ncbi:MAG: hypothetical protein ACTHOO_08815 [Alcanivorax sp.]
MPHIKVLFVLLCCFFLIAPAHAGVTVVQALSFGEFVVKRNDAQYDITVNSNGSYTFDSAGFIEIAPPQQGIFDLDGMTPFTPVLSVTVTQTSPLAGSGENLQMVNLQETHDVAVSASGVVRVSVGGTARTSGSGNPYLDQTYNGQLEIQINF